MKEKNLLEIGIPVNLVNKEAIKEKLSIPPITKMHYYFTRKPLITARMVLAGTILNASDVTDRTMFDSYLGIDPALKVRAYTKIPNVLLEKISKKGEICVLDPFAGSGMIPFEALRMGLNVTAIDYNPVSFLVMKGTLEYPLNIDKSKKDLYEDVKKYIDILLEKLQNSLIDFYPLHNGENVRTYIHAWAVTCPICGEITPLVNNWWLDKKNKIQLEYYFENGILKYRIAKNLKQIEGNVKRGIGTCLHCTSRIENNVVKKDINENERELLIALYLDNGVFSIPNESDINALKKSQKYIKDNVKTFAKYLPIEEMPDDKRAIPAKKYLKYWYKLFNSRQLSLFLNIVKEIDTIIDKIKEEDQYYATAIGTYLSMLMAQHLAYNSRSTSWDSTRNGLGNVFTNRGVNMLWNHAEPNPFIKTAGSLVINKNNLLKGLKFAISSLNTNRLIEYKKPKIEILNKSILSYESNKKYDYIITDPPYYDDVPYPELLQYFQVWHSKTLGDELNISSVPSTSEELSVNEFRTKKIFEKRMNVGIKKLYDLLKDDGILALFYAHKSISGWKYLIEALRKNNFIVTSTITLSTESNNNVIAIGKSSVFHSLLLTARKRVDNKTANLLDMEEEIRNKIEIKYPELIKIYGNDRVNLMVAASGIVIETITSYSEITSFTKNTADYAIEMGQKYLIETFARNTLHVDHVDVKTMLYTWFRHSPIDEIPYTDFNQTLKAFGAEERAIEDIIKTVRGTVKLLDFTDRGALEVDGMEPLFATTVIDAVHLALRAYARGGITLAKQGIDNSPFGANPIINTIEALARISATKTGYEEGKVCLQFIKDWNALHGKPQPTQLKERFKMGEKEQTKLKKGEA